MMARTRKKTKSASTKKKASTKTSHHKSVQKKSALHKMLTAEGWRRLVMKKSKSK